MTSRLVPGEDWIGKGSSYNKQNLTQKVCSVIDDPASVVVDAESAGEVAVVGLEQAQALLVLHLHLLHVGLGAAPHRTLHIQHLEQARPLGGGVHII